jgi:methionyl-tRNA formyltransferase
MGRDRINMKFVFFGTPEYVLPVLNALHKTFKDRHGNSPIAAVVTQPPKPVGRTKKVEYSSVDTWAHKKDIPVYFDSNKLIEDGIEADMGIVASFGAMLPDAVLSYFPDGLLNIHPSDLPEFRGASPIQAMLVTGKSEAVVSIMEITKEMDQGAIVSKFTEEINSDDTTASLLTRLFDRSAEVLIRLIPAYIEGKINPKPQDNKKAVYTKLIKKEDGFIPFELIQLASQGLTSQVQWQIPFIYTKAKDGSKTPYSLIPDSSFLIRFIRTMNPWPGVWTNVGINKGDKKVVKKLKIREAHIEENTSLRGTKQSNLLNSSNSILVLDTVQLEGKNPVSWKQFKEAYKII